MPPKIAGIALAVIVAAAMGTSGGASGRAAEGTPTTAGAGVEAAAERPAWQTIELTDARTGETFSLDDFEGKTVLVEPMAIWCPPCGEQLGNVREARARLDPEAQERDVVFVALSMEVGLEAERLAGYADKMGFDWRFAVMPPEMLRAITDEFGREAAVPQATPHFLIRPDGSATDLVTGIEETDDLVEALTEAAGA